MLERIAELLEAALERPPEDRHAFLREASGGDQELVSEVEALLAASEGADVFFEKPLLERRHLDPASAEVQLPRRRQKKKQRPCLPASHRFPLGTVLAERYRITNVLERDFRAEIYIADDLKLGLAAVLEFLPASLERDPERLEGLFEGVRRARRISHPNVCRVHDLGEVDGLRFLSMEAVDGETLGSILRCVGRLTPEKVLELGCQLSDGLEAIHSEGLLHGDLKPSNILLDDHGCLRITGAIGGFVTGTPAYTAPELLAGEQPTVQSDLYALGLALYEISTGVRPFPGDTTAQLQACRRALPVPPREYAPLDVDLEAILLRCLEPDPTARPESALLIARVARSAIDRQRTRSEGRYSHRHERAGWRPIFGENPPGRPHWDLEKQLGHEDVWLARHRKTRERRLFKFCRTTAGRRRLEHEITVFCELREKLGERDDLVGILDWDFDGATCFLETEYTEAGDLREWSEARGGLSRVTLDERLGIITQAAETFQAVHSVGVVHRDLRPSSLLIARHVDGGPRSRIAGFGVDAMNRRGDRCLYLAPERFKGRPASFASDVYALGVLLYQVIVGNPDRPLAPDWRSAVSDEFLAEVLEAVLERKPERRPSVGELVERLRTLESSRAAFT